MPYRSFLAAACALAAVACEAPPEPAPRDREGDSPRAETASTERVATPGKPGARVPAPVRERLAPQTISWPAPQAIDRDVRGRFVEADLRAIDAAGLPVLAPRDERVYAKVTAVGKASWFSLALKDAAYAADLRARMEKTELPAEGGLSVYVQGNRVAHRYPEIAPVKPTRTLRGRPSWITRNEMIWSASFEEHGVSYTVEVECSRPDDARCADESILIDVAESLVFVGGVGVAGGAR